MFIGSTEFKGKAYVFRYVGKYKVGTEALDKAIAKCYDRTSQYVDEMFAGFVTEEELYSATDDEICKLLDLEVEK